MKHSCILLRKALVQRHYSVEKFLVESQISQSGQKPAISKLALKNIVLQHLVNQSLLEFYLVNIKSGRSSLKEGGLTRHFTSPDPFKGEGGTLREIERVIIRWKLGVSEELSCVEASLADLLKVLTAQHAIGNTIIVELTNR